MRIQIILPALSLFKRLVSIILISGIFSVSVLAQKNGPVATNPTTKGEGGRNHTEKRPLHLERVSLRDPDADITAKLTRSKHARNSASHHYEKGMLYKQAANSLYNQSRYKQAYRLYEKAETELLKAAEKHEKALPKDNSFTLQPSSFTIQRQQTAAAYYHLGLVCEKIGSDKALAAECFAKARELSPDDHMLAKKLSRTKQGRALLDDKLRAKLKGMEAKN